MVNIVSIAILLVHDEGGTEKGSEVGEVPQRPSGLELKVPIRAL